jgi:hypothetical protein
MSPRYSPITTLVTRPSQLLQTLVNAFWTAPTQGIRRSSKAPLAFRRCVSRGKRPRPRQPGPVSCLPPASVDAVVGDYSPVLISERG